MDYDLLNTLSNKLAIKQNTSNSWNHNDKILYANLLKLANDDISQTMAKQKAPDQFYNGIKWEKGDGNPLIEPFVDNPEVFRGGGLLLQALLGKRWNDMKNDKQKTAEMILANLIEANAMHNSLEPWRITFGKEF